MSGPRAPQPFLRACRREPTAHTPVWAMRQIGRYLPEYQAVRSRMSLLDLCKTPEAAAGVTVRTVEVLGVDAAIIFADILLVLEPLGVGLSYVKGEGPMIARPVRTLEQVRRPAGRGPRGGRAVRLRDGPAGAAGSRRPGAADRVRGRAVHARVVPHRGAAVAGVP